MRSTMTVLMGVLVLLLALLGAVIVVLRFADLRSLRGPLAARLSEASGYEVRIDGALRIAPAFRPRLRVEDVRVFGASAADGSPLAQVGVLELGLDVPALLRRVLEIEELTLLDTRIALERDSQGRGNWEPAGDRAEDARDGDASLELRVEGVSLESFEVSYRDRSGPDPQRVWRLGFEQLSATGREGIGGERRFELKGHLGGLPLIASGRVAIDLDAEGATAVHGVALRDLDLSVGSRDTAWIDVTGKAEDLAGAQKVDIEIEFGWEHLRHLQPLVSAAAPDVGAVSGSAKLHDRDGRLGIKAFVLRGGRRKLLEIDAEGRIEDLRNREDIDLRVQVVARDLALIGAIWDTELPAIGPIEVAGRASGSAQKTTVKGLDVRLDESRLSGSLSASYVHGERPRVDARVSSDHVRLQDIGIEPRTEAAGSREPGEEAAKEAGRRPLFSPDPLPLDRLRLLDAAVAVDVERVTGRDEFLIERVTAELRLQDGNLRLHPVELTYEGGELNADARVDARPDPPALSFELQTNGIHLERIAAQLSEKPAFAGRLDGVLALESGGGSIREIAAGLSGEVSLSVRDGRLDSRYANALRKDLWHALVSDDWKDNMQRVNCFATSWSFRNGEGRAELLVLDARDTIVVGRGGVNLGSERVRMTFVPHPKDPGVLGIATSVTLAGPLQNPHLNVNEASALTSAVAGATRAVVGRLSSIITRPAGLVPGFKQLVPFLYSDPRAARACAAALAQAADVHERLGPSEEALP